MSSIKEMLAEVQGDEIDASTSNDCMSSFKVLEELPEEDEKPVEQVKGKFFDKLVKSDRVKGLSFYKKPLKGTSIEGTPFYKNVLNLVYAPSGDGKSLTTAKLLLMSSIANKDIIWFDADHNVNDELIGILGRFNHVNINVLKLANTIRHSGNAKGTVIVFDSLKDFSESEDLDTNKGSQKVMKKLRLVLETDATVIVIAHATATEDGFKIKGNQDTIESKSDVVLKLVFSKQVRKFVCTKNRVGDKKTFVIEGKVIVLTR